MTDPFGLLPRQLNIVNQTNIVNKKIIYTSDMFDVTFKLPKESSAVLPIDLTNSYRHRRVKSVTVSDWIEIKACRKPLAAGSYVFKEMFRNEKDNGKDAIIYIPDVANDAFKDIIEFLYYHKLPEHCPPRWDLLLSSLKFGIQELFDRCVDEASKKLDDINVFESLNLSIEYGIDELASQCIQHLENRFHIMMRYFPFLFQRLSHKALIQVLSSNIKLKEMRLLSLTFKWAVFRLQKEHKPETRETVREILGEAFYKIALPGLNLDEFSKCVLRSGILTAEESDALLYYVSNHFGPHPEVVYKFRLKARRDF